MTINPKFVCEFLRLVYEEKMREYWGELIYRTVFETKDFSVSSAANSGFNVQEIHKTIATKRRALLGKDNDAFMIKSTYSDLNVIEVSEHMHPSSSPAG